ncbi:MAG TPA: lysophospholipid transporter LplT [Casimicrobiaceae bacterium]|nr:lysophospholipid transporter LplT [Casimicrobiaceae bacterium]
MKRGFYTLIAAQFFSSLADQALLIGAIALLRERHSPDWLTPALQQFFVVSYVVTAPLVGPFADALTKGRVMLIANTVKVAGCLVMLTSLDPLVAYGIVGFGAATYSPAKYGILTEILPPTRLVIANSWMEGTTVASIVLGTVLGGALVSERISAALTGMNLPSIGHGLATPAETAIAVIVVVYLIAAVFNLFIPDTGVERRLPSINPVYLLREFAHCVVLLWTDRLGQLSLATTTLLWGAGATLKFIVIAWAAKVLGYNLSQAAYLQAVVIFGIAIGALLAARYVSLRGAVRVLLVGVAMGLLVIAMVLVDKVALGALLLVLLGACAGVVVVPINALLQHRGHLLMGAGHSIAVQNFNENIGILVMVGAYAVMVRADVPVIWATAAFGAFVSAAMLAIVWRARSPDTQAALVHLPASDMPPAPPGALPNKMP